MIEGAWPELQDLVPAIGLAVDGSVQFQMFQASRKCYEMKGRRSKRRPFFPDRRKLSTSLGRTAALDIQRYIYVVNRILRGKPPPPADRGTMPRQPDSGLEERILHAADVLWRRGGERALTMRAVARAAKTNTPAVYRRFNDREDLLRGLLLRIAGRIRHEFARGDTLEQMAEAYIEYALKMPHDYELFYSHARALSPRRGRGEARPIRESRPNFAFVEQVAARQLGGAPEDHTELALQLWALLHGTTTMLLAHSIPEGHEDHLRAACRSAVKALVENAGG